MSDNDGSSKKDDDSSSPSESSGVRISGSDGFNFKTTEWENSGEKDDKGSRKSSEYTAQNGGWVKTGEHETDQNVSKWNQDKRHSKK